MPPELKLRNVDEVTYERFRALAQSNGRSMEAELRLMVAEAIESGAVTPESWESAGFDQVDEIIPGRLYDVWALGDHYRIFISRGVLNGTSIPWRSHIDKLEEVDGHRVWTSPVGIPARHFGGTPDEALRDAMRWLSSWAGFDQMGRERRDAEAAERMDPGLRAIVDTIDTLFVDYPAETWRDERRASWSTSEYDFFVSRFGADEIVLSTYKSGTMLHAFATKRFLIVTDVAERIVETMKQHMVGKGDPVPSARPTAQKR